MTIILEEEGEGFQELSLRRGDLQSYSYWKGIYSLHFFSFREFFYLGSSPIYVSLLIYKTKKQTDSFFVLKEMEIAPFLEQVKIKMIKRLN